MIVLALQPEFEVIVSTSEFRPSGILNTSGKASEVADGRWYVRG